MNKINKANCLAKEYYKWQEKTKKSYNSSSNIYYYDVLVALLIAQDGLCAYSEFRLIDEKELEELKNKFDGAGKYHGRNPEIPADVEHFDSKFKQTRGWKWDNLFCVFSPLNMKIKRVREKEFIKKNGKGIEEILKPDLPKYDPFKLMEFDMEENEFLPNTNLSDKDFEIVKDIIYVLGLNWGFIKLKRKDYLMPKFEEYKLKKVVQVNQFHTAFKMMLNEL